MSVYNISNRAIQIVQAGSPETLIVNKSTKNGVVLGTSSGVGIGTGLNDTPLGPYESFAVNGASDVWAIEAALNAPATVITMENAVLWTPQQVQPNIVDPTSPHLINNTGSTNVNLPNVPPGAQGIAILLGVPTGFDQVGVVGLTTNITYGFYDPQLNPADQQTWIPLLPDAEPLGFQVQFHGVGGVGTTTVSFVWIMNGFTAGLVPDGNIASVQLANVTEVGGALTITPVAGSVFSTTPNDSRQLFPNNNVPFATSLSAGGTTTLISAGSNTWLHEFQYDIDPGTNTTANWILQDTSGTVITNLHFEGVSTTNNPPHAPIDFKGLPLAAGRGVVLKNNSGATSAIFGNLTYSQ